MNRNLKKISVFKPSLKKYRDQNLTSEVIMSEETATSEIKNPVIVMPPAEEIAKLNLRQKLNRIMLEVQYVQKTSKVSTGSGNDKFYMAVSHDDVTRLLHMPCARWGVLIIPSVISEVITAEKYEKKAYNSNVMEQKTQYRADVVVELEFSNIDNAEDIITKRWTAYAMDSMDKAIGKAISMAVKIGYLKTFMLESGDDEESRDFENRDRYPDDKRDNGGSQTRGAPPQNNRTNPGNNAGTNRGNTNDNRNRGNNTTNHNTTQGTNQNKTGEQKASPASENQIKAIKSLCDKKGIEVTEKFKAKEKCTSQEAGEEIKRISALKA